MLDSSGQTDRQRDQLQRNHLSVRERRTLGAGVGAASQDAPDQHDLQRDQFQGGISMSEKELAVGIGDTSREAPDQQDRKHDQLQRNFSAQKKGAHLEQSLALLA